MGWLLGFIYMYTLPLYLSVSIFVVLWGACIGSFLNVCIYRIPKDLSIVKPRSFCPNCKKQIPWYNNIPLISFIFLRGRCGYCRKKISPCYFLIELLTAVLFFVIWLKFDYMTGNRPLGLIPIVDWKLIPVYWLIVSGLILGTFVDLRYLIIPDSVTLGGIVAGLFFSALVPSLHNTTSILGSLIYSVIGMALGWGILWFTGFLGKLAFKKDAMGFGDVKLMGAIGAFLGWRAVLFTIMFSSLIGSVVGVGMIIIGRRAMQSKIPYGPFIALAVLIWILWGENWWHYYMNILFFSI